MLVQPAVSVRLLGFPLICVSRRWFVLDRVFVTNRFDFVDSRFEEELKWEVGGPRIASFPIIFASDMRAITSQGPIDQFNSRATFRLTFIFAIRYVVQRAIHHRLGQSYVLSLFQISGRVRIVLANVGGVRTVQEVFRPVQVTNFVHQLLVRLPRFFYVSVMYVGSTIGVGAGNFIILRGYRERVQVYQEVNFLNVCYGFTRWLVHVGRRSFLLLLQVSVVVFLSFAYYGEMVGTVHVISGHQSSFYEVLVCEVLLRRARLFHWLVVHFLLHANGIT